MGSTPDEDRSLWMRLREGDKEALSALFLSHASSLFNYGLLLCRDRQKVEDCVQDLFFQLWQNSKKLPEVNCIKTYLIIALRNRIQSTFRIRSLIDSTKNVETVFIAEAGAEEAWISHESIEQQNNFVHQGMETLPHRMKQAIYLRYFENLDYTEIAKIMNIQKQVVINMVYRALTHLRQYSQDYSTTLFP